MKTASLIRFFLIFRVFVHSTAIGQEPDRGHPEQLFAHRVFPLLHARCYGCHGSHAEDTGGGIDLRTGESILSDVERGRTLIVPGSPERSLLYRAVRRSDADVSAMPPKESDRLSDSEMELLRIWIESGAPWPTDERRIQLVRDSADEWRTDNKVRVSTAGALSEEWSQRDYDTADLWAYRPVVKPALSDSDHCHPIDQLIAWRQPDGMLPAGPADARTFIRRATFDLTGLPPSIEECDQFEKEWSIDADAATGRLVDRLLNSPHYGERMARHWLDVVRYADTSGFANDYDRGNAWRYRDYVVRSFNDNKPYDQFILEQIAGDELDESDPEMLIAVGFLRMGPWELTGMEVPRIARQRFLDDVTNSIGETFLAHSLQCARCHDHKFDPVPSHDYYAIQACFATTQPTERDAAFLPVENRDGFAERRYLDILKNHHHSVLARLDQKLLQNAADWFHRNRRNPDLWNSVVEEIVASPAVKRRSADDSSEKADPLFGDVFTRARQLMSKKNLPEDQYPPKYVGFEPEDFGNERVARKGLERLRWEMDRYQPFALSVYSGATPEYRSVHAPLRLPADRLRDGTLETTSILIGGDPFTPGRPVTPGVLSVTGSRTIPEAINQRRTALARWIADPDNPLTARVIMNRLWQWHFGQAIAGNPNNFGSTGRRPTHPELLDWLAATLVEQQWSLREMHRLIMTSAAYRRSSHSVSGQFDEVVSREEAERQFLVFRPRRLTAEELRDAMLFTSGELNPALGGIPNRPEINMEVALQPRQVMGTFAAAWVPNPQPSQRHRRSLYALKIRGIRDPFMEVFDEPSPDFSCEQRDTSFVTPQVFSLFNGKPSYQRALALAVRGLKESPTAPIRRVFELSLGRRPSDAEQAACELHWTRMTAHHSSIHLVEERPPLRVRREAVEENTGERFHFDEPLPASEDFVPDLHPSRCDARTRALGDVCLVLMNTHEFAFVY